MILCPCQALDAPPGELVATHLAILILANGSHGEPHAFAVHPLVEQHAVPEHALPEQCRRVIEHHDIE
jgi:hypothetical protein